MINKVSLEKAVKWLINKRIVLIIFGLIAVGVFLRFYQVGNIFQDGDSSGTLNGYKRDYPPLTTIHLFTGRFAGLQATYDTVGMSNNLLNSILYPVWIGRSFTYPVGQYFFYPLLIRENYSNHIKFVLAESISAFFSSLSLVLLVYLLYLMNNRKADNSLLIPLAFLVFSFNSVLYAHHLSPYSVIVTATLTALVFFLRTLEGRMRVELFYICCGVLTIFNYLTVLMMPIFTLLFIIYFKIYSIQEIKKSIKKFMKGIVFYIIIFLPFFVLFFKPGHGQGNLSSVKLGFFSTIIYYFIYFPKQFLISLASAVAGFSRYNFFNFTLTSVVLFFGFYIFIKKWRTFNKETTYLLFFSILFWAEWLVLHGLNKIILAESRHMLLWLPLFCFFVYIVLHSLSFRYKNWLVLITLFIICIFGITENVLIINNKLNAFNFSIIEKASTSDTIILFGVSDTLRNYFWGKKHVYSTRYDVFDFNEVAMPDEMLLVSNSQSWQDYVNSIPSDPPYMKQNIDTLLRLYQVKRIIEQPSANSFVYNNSLSLSEMNGFFLYRLIKKKDIVSAHKI
ncbi:MAG: hypothetical protein Q7R95_00995 [bacterium]|nr:hypothetical protein [bacterium]